MQEGAPVIGENRIDADFKEILKVNIQFGTCWQGHGAWYTLGNINEREKPLRP